MKISKNLICASLFTGVFDVNRSELLPEDNFLLIEKWCLSIQKLDLKGVVFHNTFSEKTIAENENKNIQFIKVDFNTTLNANVYRYLVYFDFLKKHQSQIEQVFFTDISDVEVVNNPFSDPFFIRNPSSLFCCDEAEILDNPWMKNHCRHLRDWISDFHLFEEKYKGNKLLNCGVIGGRTETMLSLLEELCWIHSTITIRNKTSFTLDMGAFNYVARTQFADRLNHGFPINTQFKGYESERMDCWFRHK
ncbi:hypothetical protein [Algoriphagus litoralis]|uniref:hypothetical protein n=1 Tax=Algoriphagus litoralis TaxID=2202829 RepID=UPI000DB97B26|nr:hypothetical protein [Algoriphagus litoralis]